ncbi:MAG TPA: hypothetical protein VEL76_34260 [Gemmataceae bacterium]|nr:hypothetical protein [Gemmataceae bacterium]
MFLRSCCARLPNGFTLIAIVFLALNYLSPFGDLDFAWQIRTGALIVHTGDLRPAEAFSYTIPGAELPDFEWLYEVILWAFWTVLGHGGLKLLQTFLVFTPFCLLMWRLRTAGVRWHGIALTLLTAVVVLSPAWNLRPLYCTSIGLLLVVGLLHDHCTGKRPLPWWLPLIMLLWANLHPGVILGQAILLGAIAWEWLNRWVRLNVPLDPGRLRRLTVVGGLGLAATFLAPDPLERLLYPFRPELAHPIMRIFIEMQPLYSFLSKSVVTTVVPYVVAALVALTLVLRFRAYRLWEVATLLGLAALANVAFRSLQDWLLVMLALGVPHLAALLRQAAANRQRPWTARLLRLDCACKRLFNSRLLRFQPAWLIAALVALTALSLLPPVARRLPISDGDQWPTGAVDHIEAKGLSGRFFGPPDYGAYLTWRLGERARIYTDTRGFFFPPLLLEDSHFIPQLGPEWRRRLERVLDDYRTEYFLLETNGPRARLWQRLQPHLDSPPLYCDHLSVLLTAAQVRSGIAKF